MSNRIPVSIAGRLRQMGIGDLTPHPHPGLSGAQIYRGVSTAGHYCLRRWPQSATSTRVQQIHRYMFQLAGDCPFMPKLHCLDEGLTHVYAQSRVWDLCDWMPGVAPELGVLSPIQMEAAVRAVAQLHEAASRWEANVQRVPAVAERIARIDQIRQSPWAEAIPHCTGELDSLAQRFSRLWKEFHGPLRFQLFECQEHSFPTFWVARDIHREHILFEGDRVSGIIDFDAARVDSPALDLARLLRSFSTSERLPVDMLAVYRSVRPFSQQEEQLMTLLDRATCLLSAGNWVEWLCVEQRCFEAGSDRALDRFRTVVEQAEMLFS